MQDVPNNENHKGKNIKSIKEKSKGESLLFLYKINIP